MLLLKFHCSLFSTSVLLVQCKGKHNPSRLLRDERLMHARQHQSMLYSRRCLKCFVPVAPRHLFSKVIVSYIPPRSSRRKPSHRQPRTSTQLKIHYSRPLHDPIVLLSPARTREPPLLTFKLESSSKVISLNCHLM